MTKEEREKAIDLLDNLRGMIEDSQGNDYDFALKIGIEALRDKTYELWKESYYAEVARNSRLKEKIKALEKEPCEDCISRQAASEFLESHAKDFKEPIIRMALKAGASLLQNADYVPSVTPTVRWVPIVEEPPKERDWYLGIFKEPDTGWINPVPFICDYVGCKTDATTKEYWILNGFTDRDEHIDYYFNLECVAWMPLPKPYKAEMESEE